MQTNPVPQTEKKGGSKTIIWIVVAAILLCCCVATAIAGWTAYQAYLEAQRVAEEIENLDIPTDVPFIPVDPNGTPVVPDFDATGDTPSGGLADDETRGIAWASVQVVAIISGCNAPTAEGTTITVVQQPDASGAWREDWNVNCGDGTYRVFPLTFTTENGVVSVTVNIQP